MLFIDLFGHSTYQLKILGWYMVSYMVLERVSMLSFLCSSCGTCHSCIAHVAGPSIKSIGPAHEGECWEVPYRTSPKSSVGQGFIYMFEPSTYQRKLLDWYMVSYRYHLKYSHSSLEKLCYLSVNFSHFSCSQITFIANFFFNEVLIKRVKSRKRGSNYKMQQEHPV